MNNFKANLQKIAKVFLLLNEDFIQDMKKAAIFLSSILVIAFGVWLLNAFSLKIDASGSSETHRSNSIDYATKYSDCIDGARLSSISELLKEFRSDTELNYFKEINGSLLTYEKTLDSMVSNLNTIDAHDFLHSEYDKLELELTQNNLPKPRKYYLAGAMEICHELDKSLNLTSAGLVKH